MFGEVSTVAHNDLFRATDIARSMIKEYGMSDELGPVTFEQERRPLFIEPVGLFPTNEYSEDTAERIDDEVAQLVVDTYKKVRPILEENQKKMEMIAKVLLEKEVIEGDKMGEMIR
ncbi:MAG: hypothetical protein JRJ29_14140 [Deltaproteobacteria bacterium]|nr:hypothetical protein [Deltaproteobacteria bacterium]